MRTLIDLAVHLVFALIGALGGIGVVRYFAAGERLSAPKGCSFGCSSLSVAPIRSRAVVRADLRGGRVRTGAYWRWSTF